MKYYVVSSKDDPPDKSKAFLRSLSSVTHPQCGHIKAPPPKDIVVGYFEGSEVLTFHFLGQLIVRVDLLEFLGFNDPSIYSLGTIVDEKGRSFPDHRTVWSNKRVLIRGLEGSLSEPCEHCGCISYFAHGNVYYLTRKSVQGVSVAMVDGPALLIVNEEVWRVLREKREAGQWRKLWLWGPIKVRDHAIDGLPDDYTRRNECI